MGRRERSCGNRGRDRESSALNLVRQSTENRVREKCRRKIVDNGESSDTREREERRIATVYNRKRWEETKCYRRQKRKELRE